MPHGGARPGAGRPRSVERVAGETKIVLNKLRGGAQAGWEVLADEYPSLMRVAVAVAFGEFSDGKPDRSMLKTLLELMPKVIGTDEEEGNSTVADLVRNLRARIDNVTIEVHS